MSGEVHRAMATVRAAIAAAGAELPGNEQDGSGPERAGQLARDGDRLIFGSGSPRHRFRGP